ncbi:MAG TPA: carbonate dehydratase [Steroidobacteraceae bacterium]|nr:carbonate dehydratase [Steroidobacteraceae bacterium]
MNSLQHLIDSNRRWAEHVRSGDADFFSRLARQQSPRYLWIGCSDSRVPANEIVGLPPGELFVHRNVANVVVHTDLNCLTVIQFAVDLLKVRHIIVCGHYGCSGVRSVLSNERIGLSDNWLRHVRDVGERHEPRLAGIGEQSQRERRLCELNVIEQVAHVCQTSILGDAWDRGQQVEVHGWIYGLDDGLVRDLQCSVSERSAIRSSYSQALAALSPAR